jgi:uncharacterized protein (DUF1778 family)
MKSTKSENINFRSTPEMRKFLDKVAAKHDRSMGYVIVEMISYFMKNPPDSMPIKKK